MTPFSADAAQVIVNVEQIALDWLLGYVPVSALVLIAAVGLAVSWLSWTEEEATRRTPATSGRKQPPLARELLDFGDVLHDLEAAEVLVPWRRGPGSSGCGSSSRPSRSRTRPPSASRP